MFYDEFRAMNSDILLAASGDDLAMIQEGFAKAREIIRHSERRFTRFSQTSELMQLNHSAGDWLRVSAEMFEVMKAAYELVDETGGLFNPSILPALVQAGYDRTMDELRNIPAQTTTTSVGELIDFRQIQLDEATCAIRLPYGMQVDLGGIAKGWIAEQAAMRLAIFSRACTVSAGGDMVLVGLPPGEASWEVGLENPLAPEKDLAVLHIGQGALVTSSVTKRTWHKGGKAQHHLIDPRSGTPAQTDWLSVTVWAEHAVDGEAYAKAILIGGAQVAAQFQKNKPSMAYLAVDRQGWVQGSSNYHEVFHV